MNTSNITKSALALALGLCASGTWAVTVTNVIEQFTVADDTAVTSLTTANLNWTTEGTDNASIVSGDNDNLVLDTGDGLVRATLTTNDVTKAIADGQTATFEASVSFTPATSDPTIADDNSDLKFALFAKVNVGGTDTNLCVVSSTGTNTVNNISIGDATAKKVKVTFLSANTFNVAVDGTVAGGNGSPTTFTFIGNRTNFNKVEFQGNGTVDDLVFAYNYAKSSQDPVQISGDPNHKLTATEAKYLNDLVAQKGAAAVDKALTTTDAKTLDKAALLNQDITAANADSYSFGIKKISKSGSNVTVTVELTRNGTPAGGIKGTLVLQTCETPNGTYADADKQDITDTNFKFDTAATTATADVVFTGSYKFFKVVIR